MKILIKDENNFIILTNYGTLKFYKKEGENYLFKSETKNEKLVSDMSFDNSKNKLFCIAKGFIKVFEDNNNNGNYSKIKEITVPEFLHFHNYWNYFDEYGYDGNGNRILLLEDKNILIVKEERKLSFFNISENYKLYKVYEENIFSNILAIDRYDEDNIIIISHYRTLKVISINENEAIKNVKEINKEKDFSFCILKTILEKNIIILGGEHRVPRSYLNAIIQILRLDNLEIIQTIKASEYFWRNEIYILKNDLIATIFDEGLKLWNI